MVSLRTYEILAKWIAAKQRVSIRFEPNATPCACIQTNEIILPSNINEENVYGALAQLMHEAGHLRHTSYVPVEKITEKDGHKFGILNAVEDVRVDLMNFNILPNVREFYKRMMKQYKDLFKDQVKKNPLHVRCLCRGILELEKFSQFKATDNEADKFNKKHDIALKMNDIVYNLSRKDWDKVKGGINELYKIFGLDKLPKEPLPTPLPDGFTLDGKGSKSVGQSGGQKKGQGSSTTKIGQKPGHSPQGQSNGQGPRNIMDATKDKVFASAKGQGTGRAVGSSTIGEIALREQTRQRFKELLNITEIKKTSNGLKLDTDNLTAFLTGDIEELFCEEKIVKRKKSKIMIIMDGSGSMGGQLFDHSERRSVVGGCVRSLTKVLDEVINLEGINVDYTIAGFDSDLDILSKDNWEEEYNKMCGGTNLLNAFTKAQDYLLKDLEADGKKIIVFFTDGDVNFSQVEEVKKRIIQHNEDVRCMIIGVGANICDRFVEDICGDYNILAKECADMILLDVIMEML